MPSRRNRETMSGTRWRIRRAIEDDLSTLSALCFRSKAVWGYDDDFMRAAAHELTFSAGDLDTTSIGVGLDGDTLAGTVQIEVSDGVADLLKLFVDPAAMRSGLGGRLFDWGAHEARRLGATRMIIESDPAAVPFYERMGAGLIGTAPSGSIAGRSLPLLRLDLVA